MKRELELKARKLLQEQKNAGKITKREYEKELNFIKKWQIYFHFYILSWWFERSV